MSDRQYDYETATQQVGDIEFGAVVGGIRMFRPVVEAKRVVSTLGKVVQGIACRYGIEHINSTIGFEGQREIFTAGCFDLSLAAQKMIRIGFQCDHDDATRLGDTEQRLEL